MICPKCSYVDCSGGELCAGRVGTLGKGVHTDWCEGDGTHWGMDCTTATELVRLRAFAEIVLDEFVCTDEAAAAAAAGKDDHVDDCWHCFALRALEKPGS